MEMHRISAAIMLQSAKMIIVFANEYLSDTTARFFWPPELQLFQDLQTSRFSLFSYRAVCIVRPCKKRANRLRSRRFAHPARQQTVDYKCSPRVAWVVTNYCLGQKRNTMLCCEPSARHER